MDHTREPRAAARAASLEAVRKALVAGGATFLPDDGKGAGARGKPKEKLNNSALQAALNCFSGFSKREVRVSDMVLWIVVVVVFGAIMLVARKMFKSASDGKADTRNVSRTPFT
jgi:hypothetical protein